MFNIDANYDNKLQDKYCLSVDKNYNPVKKNRFKCFKLNDIIKNSSNDDSKINNKSRSKSCHDPSRKSIATCDMDYFNSEKSAFYYPGLNGLKNLGNTCFMNSAIQCLSNIPELKYYLLFPFLKGNIKESISESFAELIKLLWQDSAMSNTISPHSLKQRISKLSSRFEGFDQQDSHEFLVYLLDGLHEELKTKTNYQTSFKEIIVPNNKIDAEFQRLSSSLWKSYLNNNSSKISLLFHFMICSITICLSCNYASLKFDPTSFITLPISDSKKKADEPVLIENCFKNLTKWKISHSNEYYCAECKHKTMTKEKFIFCNLPPVLIVQLNRFEFNFYGKIKSSQLARFSSKLDLTDYFYGYDMNYSAKYDLVAVSNHYGSFYGGHYDTFAKNEISQKWYRFNDNYVQEICKSKLCTENAYYLIYIKEK